MNQYFKNNVLLVVFFIVGLLSSHPLMAGKSKYKYQLAVSMMFQNEAEWLREWIEYHRLVGVEHFYLFDNGSQDHFMEVLEPYIEKGIVEIYHFPQVGSNQEEYLSIQKHLMMQSIHLAKYKAKWLAIIDADEYIVPIQANTVLQVLKKYENYGGVYVNWLCFGTSHVEKIPSGVLMIEALTHCAATPVSVGKSIVRPERVENCTSPHYMKYKAPFYHVNTEKKSFENNNCPLADKQLLIHHYYTRDIDHVMRVKLPRRRKWMSIENAYDYLQQLESFNATYNDAMQRFIPSLKTKVFSKNKRK